MHKAKLEKAFISYCSFDWRVKLVQYIQSMMYFTSINAVVQGRCTCKAGGSSPAPNLGLPQRAQELSIKLHFIKEKIISSLLKLSIVIELMVPAFFKF